MSGFIRSWLSSVILLIVMIGVTSTESISGEARNINFAAFQKINADFEFDPIVLGKFSDFITVMEGSQVLLLSHSGDSIDGDVINIQQDVLRQSSTGLGDVGINCQLSFHDDSTEESTSYDIGGICRILDIGEGQEGKEGKLTVLIPMTGLPDTAQGVDAWVMLHEDEASGIAFYANVSVGH